MELPCLDCKKTTLANHKSKIFVGVGGRFYLCCSKCVDYRKIVRLVDEENDKVAQSFYNRNQMNP